MENKQYLHNTLFTSSELFELKILKRKMDTVEHRHWPRICYDGLRTNQRVIIQSTEAHSEPTCATDTGWWGCAIGRRQWQWYQLVTGMNVSAVW